MKSIYEEAGGTYTRQGDYELPNLIISPEKEIEIGVWGRRYRRHLKQCHRIRYYNLLTAGTLNEHLTEVDQQAEHMPKGFWMKQNTPLPRRAMTNNTLTCPAVWMRQHSAGASSTKPCRSITSGLP